MTMANKITKIICTYNVLGSGGNIIIERGNTLKKYRYTWDRFVRIDKHTKNDPTLYLHDAIIIRLDLGH